MTFQAHRYPRDWKQITAGIRLRTNNACAQCRAPNGETIVRDDERKVYVLPHGETFDARTGAFVGYTRGSELDGRSVRVVLTVAHLDHDETNNADDNLAALCQKCHLAHDRDDNHRRAQASRSAKRERIDRLRGQTALPLDPAPATKRQTPSQKASP